LPNVALERIDRAARASGLTARLPFIDREVGAAAARLDSSKGRASPLGEFLRNLLPGVRLADRRRGLALDLRQLVDGHFANQVERQLADPQSALNAWTGAIDNGLARRRAERSPQLAFRLAMLDEWQSLYGSDVVWDS